MGIRLKFYWFVFPIIWYQKLSEGQNFLYQLILFNQQQSKVFKNTLKNAFLFVEFWFSKNKEKTNIESPSENVEMFIIYHYKWGKNRSLCSVGSCFIIRKFWEVMQIWSNIFCGDWPVFLLSFIKRLFWLLASNDTFLDNNLTTWIGTH